MASAQATQVVTIRYPYDAPDRLKDGMREVTLSTEEDRAREHRGQRGYIIGMRHGKILVRLDDDTEALFLPVELTSKGVDA